MKTSTDIHDMAGTFASISNAREMGYALADFVDRFNRDPDASMVENEPPLIASVLRDGGLADGYLAATAAWLCRQHGLSVPGWAEGASRALKEPWFAAQTPNLRQLLFTESPSEFRVRNIYVSANALSRV